MRLAHLADLHIGFRQFSRSNPAGANQREADVNHAMVQVVADLLTVKPDLIVIAGDVFHSIRPTNGAILFLFQELQRLRLGLPDTPIVMVAGNHDTPRSSDSGSILGLYRALGVSVALSDVQRFQVPGHCIVTAVPSAAAGKPVEPIPGWDNVLVIHGEVKGFGAEEVAPSVLEGGWHYVALGHYHVRAKVAERAWYAGSIEYTSTDPWGEKREERERDVPGKGYLLVTLEGERYAVEFRPVDTRRFLDLGPLDCSGLLSAQIDAVIDRTLEAEPIDGSVVRLTLENISRLTQQSLNHPKLREWKGRALNLQVHYGRPPEEFQGVEARKARMKRLEEIVAEFLGNRTLPPDVERAELARLGAEYLDLVRREGAESAASTEADSER